MAAVGKNQSKQAHAAVWDSKYMYIVAPPSQALQRSERELAALDSKFLNVEGIEVHYKSRSPRPVHARPPPAQRPATAAGAPALDPSGVPAPAPAASTGSAAAPAGATQQAQQHQGLQGQQPAQQPLRVLRGVHCLHGFGASAYSWSFVQDELARELGAVVTAHDMPGFGLTQR